jgi:hypothetical protein
MDTCPDCTETSIYEPPAPSAFGNGVGGTSISQQPQANRDSFLGRYFTLKDLAALRSVAAITRQGSEECVIVEQNAFECLFRLNEALAAVEGGETAPGLTDGEEDELVEEPYDGGEEEEGAQLEWSEKEGNEGVIAALMYWDELERMGSIGETEAEAEPQKTISFFGNLVDRTRKA